MPLKRAAVRFQSFVARRWSLANQVRSDSRTTIDYRPTTVLVTDAAKIYISRICTNLQDGAAAIQLTVGSHRFRPPLSAFAGNVNIGKIAADAMPIGDFDLGSNGDRQIVGQINGDVAGRSLQGRVAANSRGGEQFDNDATRRGLRLYRCRSV